MTENDMTGALFAYIRKEEPDSFVWKIHDDYRGGIPDGFVIVGGPHTWMEMKKLRSRKANPCDMLSELQKKQVATLATLGQEVWVVGYVDNWRTVKVYRVIPHHVNFGVSTFAYLCLHDDSAGDAWIHGIRGTEQQMPPKRGRVHPVLELLRWRKRAQSSATLVA